MEERGDQVQEISPWEPTRWSVRGDAHVLEENATHQNNSRHLVSTCCVLDSGRSAADSLSPDDSPGRLALQSYLMEEETEAQRG